MTGRGTYSLLRDTEGHRGYRQLWLDLPLRAERELVDSLRAMAATVSGFRPYAARRYHVTVLYIGLLDKLVVELERNLGGSEGYRIRRREQLRRLIEGLLSRWFLQGPLPPVPDRMLVEEFEVLGASRGKPVLVLRLRMDERLAALHALLWGDVLGMLSRAGVQDSEAFAAGSLELGLNTRDQYLAHLTLGRLRKDQLGPLPMIDEAADLWLKLGGLTVHGAVLVR